MPINTTIRAAEVKDGLRLHGADESKKKKGRGEERELSQGEANFGTDD